MFRNDNQRVAACCTLLSLTSLDVGTMWTEVGPSAAAERLLERSDGVGASASAMLGVVWAIWSGHRDTPVSALFEHLEPDQLSAVGELLRAVSLGTEAVDRWLTDWDNRTRRRPEPGSL